MCLAHVRAPITDTGMDDDGTEPSDESRVDYPWQNGALEEMEVRDKARGWIGCC